MAAPISKPGYGIDAPPVVLTFVALTFVFAFAGIFIGSGSSLTNAIFPWIAAVLFAATAAYMVSSSIKGKPALWSRLLDDLALRGTEDSLDIGCGRGLVLIETAKRLPHGKATGIDIWRPQDQSGNTRRETEHNAQIEGVAERVEVIDADMTELPFEDSSFDLVTASLAIHNVRAKDDRAAALREIARVLRPAGRVLIIDIARTAEYADVLGSCELEAERSGMRFSIYPPVRLVTARKILSTEHGGTT